LKVKEEEKKEKDENNLVLKRYQGKFVMIHVGLV